MFISAMDAETPGFETDCTPFRTAFNEMMDRILSINANELDCVKKEVEDLQCHLLGKIRESRNIHSRATPSSTPSTVLPVVTAPRGPKIKLDLPDFNGNPTEWRHFHRLSTSAMTSRGSEFSNHEKVCILLKSMKTAEAQRIVQSHVNSDSCYDEAMEALTAKKYLKSRRGCINCLGLDHQVQQCSSAYNCRKCNGRHHTSLHSDDALPSAQPPIPSLMATPMPENSALTRDDPPQIAFLHTAIVKAINGDHDCMARVAFDTGSASSLVTETLAAQLKLKRHHQRLSLSGPYGEGTSLNFVSITLHSIHDPNQFISLKLSVVPKLPQAFPPNRRVEIAAVPHHKDLQLADPAFGGPLDILIGSLDYGRCIRGSLTYNLTSDLSALPTILGWTVTGPLDYTPPASTTLKIGSTDNTSPPDLSQLWELDMTPEVTSSSMMEDASISHFLDTHSVSAEGRYAVQLPRVPNPPELGQSRTLAVQRFLSNERSLRKQGIL